MTRTFIRQDDQISQSNTYNDNITPSLANLITAATSIQDDLNALRSVTSYLKDQQAGNWYDTLVAPSTFEGGVTRGVDNLNQDLHDLEHKRILRYVAVLPDLSIPTGSNYVIVPGASLPTNTTAAVDNVTTLGTVVAHNTAFGTPTLALVSGSTAIDPKNLCQVVDSYTREPLLDVNNNDIFALAQSESAVDGSTLGATTPNRAQLTFVTIDTSANSHVLKLAPTASIGGKVVDVQWVERVDMLTLNEQDFLRGAIVDVAGGTTVTRQIAYDNQGTLPVDLNTNATLDLNSAGIFWEVRDLAEATLLRVTEGSTGGTSAVTIASDVDTLNVNSVTNNVIAGLHVRTGGVKPINVGVTDGVINTTAGNLEVLAAANLFLDDAHQAGSSWTGTTGLQLSSATSEWTAYKTNFGEVSLMAALDQAFAHVTHTKLTYIVPSNISAGTDVTTTFGDLSLASDFTANYDLYLNGVLLQGSNSSSNVDGNDYYPGSNLSLGKIKFAFKLKGTGTNPDVLTIVKYV
jgi:hypothetical protein